MRFKRVMGSWWVIALCVFNKGIDHADLSAQLMYENRCWTMASSWGTRTRQLVYVHPQAMLSGERPR